ncbi:MAG TPA: DUF6259 domain-containing protein [Gaiellaceae bacterium]|nr:DUF6259 domain-containing protein [Gaiellaceae bacterium]
MLLTLAAGAAVLGAGSAGGAQGAPALAGQRSPVATFNAKRPDRLVLTTATYRLVLAKHNGALAELVDRRTGARLLRGQAGCAWAIAFSNGQSDGGCSYSRVAADRFTYGWAPRASRLTLRYRPETVARPEVVVTLSAARDHLDLRLSLAYRGERTIASVLFPADLVLDVGTTSGVYTPTFLPGLRLLPSFFSAPRRNVERYPSRWAFADFVAADVGRSHVALSTVNPAPAPLAPVDLGVVHDPEPAPCSGAAYCLTHAFQTWLRDGDRWTSPTVRLRVGGSVERSILAYRRENGIESYPSLQAKLGERLDVLSRAPLVKIDPWKGLPPFAEWDAALRRLPSPSLLHPVAFQARGHDEDYPDFLPPDPRWGSVQAFNGTLDRARALGHVVMPYLNVSWWDTQAPSVRNLPAPLTATDIAVQTSGGEALTEQFGPKDGYIVSPHAPYVRERVVRLLEEWRSDVPVECLFFDQIGARPWRRDFNPAAPSPLAYQDGWLATFAPFRARCLMTEDGWDRLADAFVGFHGGVLQMEREHRWPERRFGAESWEPFPLALWLVHDKVLMYQHDLYDETLTTDPEVLLYNVAFGTMLSYAWDAERGTLDSPWLDLVGRVQRALGPHVAGQPLTRFRRLAPDVTETVFGDYSVVANWSRAAAYDHEGRRLAPLGFLARRDGRVVAAALGETWSGVVFGAE